MNKKIEEAAKDFVKGYYLDGKFPSDISDIHYEAEDLFKAGAEWALKNQWRSVGEDGLPPYDEYIVPEQSEPVLVVVSSKMIPTPQILVYNHHFNCWDDKYGDDYVFDISDDDIWMPIPELP